MKGLFFWSGDQYALRTLVIFKNPDLFLILCFPNNVAKVHPLLNIPDKFDVAGEESKKIVLD